MFLKRLEINGFKSFATKSVIDFDNQKSITSIVGPNGSGKSNVADAVRWVLGEQSYKTIRSKKSEDVIFSGSNGKSKASGARVSMILDNSDGKAPIDFNEVEVERAVYRDGSSEYLINGKRARLLDVAELLARSGFGQSTYSVIGQGMVDSMLFYGPAERKVLFDEAAGVRQYEIKREQTIRKLSDTASNIIRIKDILSELNPRLNTLRRQAEKAKHKDEISLVLVEKQKIYFTSIWEKLTHNEKGKRLEISKIVEEEQKIKRELGVLNEKFENILHREKADNSKLDKIREKIRTLEEKKELLRQEIYTQRAQLQVKYSDSFSRKNLEEKIELFKKQLAELGIDGYQEKKKNLLKKISEARFDEQSKALLGLESEKDRLKEEFFSIQARINLGSGFGGLSSEEIDAKISKLNTELNELKIAEKERTIEKLQKEILIIEKKIESFNEKIEAKRKELEVLSKELQEFDFGTVGEELGQILESQNLLLIKISSAKGQKEISELSKMGRGIALDIEKLIGKVKGARKGTLSGMTEIQKEIEALSRKKEEIISEKNIKKGDLLDADHLLVSLKRRRSEIKEEIEKVKKIKPVNLKEKDQLQRKASLIQDKIEKLDSTIVEKKSYLNEKNDLENELKNIDFAIDRSQKRGAEIQKEIDDLKKIKPIDEKERESFEEKIKEKEKEVEKINSEIVGVQKELSLSSNDFATAGKELTDIKDDIAQKQSLINEYSQESTRIQVELAKVETKKQDIRDEIKREIGDESKLVGVKAIIEIDEEAARSEIEKLKTKLYAIGEIDPEVEGEYQEVEKRVSYLGGQIEDLEKAKEDLEKMIKDLDAKIKKQFEISFDLISKKFKHFFGLLFDGGEAKLELVVQKDDDFESDSGDKSLKRDDKFGVEITAVPPGKKVRSLSALSGGERTLTSLALLFAILSVNPAPFILLDEVDAALDESNTKRFLKIVKELSRQTQFIFITHNRETMKEGDIIYGVTMDDTHASKLLSVKLEEAISVVKK